MLCAPSPLPFLLWSWWCRKLYLKYNTEDEPLNSTTALLTLTTTLNPLLKASTLPFCAFPYSRYSIDLIVQVIVSSEMQSTVTAVMNITVGNWSKIEQNSSMASQTVQSWTYWLHGIVCLHTHQICTVHRIVVVMSSARSRSTPCLTPIPFTLSNPHCWGFW